MQTNHFFQFSNDKKFSRKDACSLCKQQEGSLIGKMNFIGLDNYNVVQCFDCGLISFDPVPTSRIVSEGCSLLYQLQQANEPKTRILRGFARSYRRGIRFAHKYLRPQISLRPLKILEVGPGDGYFSQGIAKVYKDSKITYVDVVEDLATYYQQHFECQTHTGEFVPGVFETKEFDLIIIRDLLEHLRDPKEFLQTAYQSLRSNGILFFITPNGREDIWPCFQRYKHTGEEFLIYLNHFHYYLPETLDRLLKATGFNKLKAFKFGLKHHRQGLGHKEFTDFPKQELPPKTLEKKISISSTYWKHNPLDVTTQILHNGSPISKIYSAVSDREKEKVDFYDPRGHEFFVLAQKNESL